MNEKYVQLIEDLVEVSRSALRISKKCEVLAVNAAKLYESTATPGNNARQQHPLRKPLVAINRPPKL